MKENSTDLVIFCDPKAKVTSLIWSELVEYGKCGFYFFGISRDGKFALKNDRVDPAKYCNQQVPVESFG
jgi:hypothetical protein